MREVLPHAAPSPNNQYLRPRPETGLGGVIGLADPGLPKDRAIKLFDVIGIEPGLLGLSTALGNQVFLAGGMIDRQLVNGLEGDNLLDTRVALRQQTDDLLVNRVDFLAQTIETRRD